MLEDKLKKKYIYEILRYSPNKSLKHGKKYFDYVSDCFDEYVSELKGSIEDMYKEAYEKSLKRFRETYWKVLKTLKIEFYYGSNI